ncbi:MAG: putative lipid II flippase FtsW [Proteobacteria bacterium]|nr:putative lipid II flippase FtsW [Pseudomonadota bacterium]
MLFPFVFLLSIGAIMVLSAGTSLKGDNQFSALFIRHLAMIMLGFFALLLALLIPLEKWQDNIYWLLLLAIFLMILVLFPGIGVAVKGAKRWINTPFGVRLQPSFICKLVLIMFMASSLSKKTPEKLTSFKKGVLPYIIIIFILGLLFMGEPDFGGFFVVLTISFLMLIIGGTPFRYWFTMISGLMIPGLIYLANSQSYRAARIKAFLDIWRHQEGASYQIVQSLYSFAAGGITGMGIGMGRQKISFLPEAHTDFIFAVVGEEMGFVGCLTVLTAFLFITIRGLIISIKLCDKNNYFALLACGITLFISLEAVINMLVTLSLAPPKGLPLPFVSYGGTATICYMFAVGLLLNLSRRAED